MSGLMMIVGGHKEISKRPIVPGQFRELTNIGIKYDRLRAWYRGLTLLLRIIKTIILRIFLVERLCPTYSGLHSSNLF